jgi:hypothetical protein
VTTSQPVPAAVRWLLAVVLATLGGVAAHAPTGTTAAYVAPSAYDTPAVSRVDARELGAVRATQMPLIDPQEESASPLRSARGTSTTPNSSANATNTRMSGATTVGETDLATSNMRKFSTRNPEPGYYDVVGHGSPNDVAGMSPGRLADQIRTSSGGQNVRLLSCQTGCPSGTFAQDLADDLGVRVMAPTTDIGASNTGKTLTIFDGGEWRWFDPGN